MEGPWYEGVLSTLTVQLVHAICACHTLQCETLKLTMLPDLIESSDYPYSSSLP